MKRKLKVFSRNIQGDVETPITIYKKFIGEEIGYLLESKDGTKGRYSIIGKNPLAIIKCRGRRIQILDFFQGRKKEEKEGLSLEAIKNYMDTYEVDYRGHEHFPFIGGFVGSIGYDLIKQYEAIEQINPDELRVPDVHQMFAKEMLIYDHLHQKITLLILEKPDEDSRIIEERLDQMESLINAKREVTSSCYRHKVKGYEKVEVKPRSNFTKKGYMEIVEKAKKLIYEGDIFQVVLSQRWTIRKNMASFELYRRLRSINPSAYMFYLNFRNYQIAGASPEMLVELRKDKIYTCPIAGTRKRGKNLDEDDFLAEELLNDPKERSEHTMLVDLGRNDMGRVSRIGHVKVLEFMKIKKYAHVMHLVSLVEGKKVPGKDMFDILATFLPAGTLSGAPKIRAMEIIEELENTKRGIYGGAVGYLGFNNEMDMCIAIRTMIIDEENIYLQAGAGIVADSDPEKEYEETENKVKSLLAAISSNP